MSVHIEADFIVPVDDYQVTDFAAFVIGDLRYFELRTGIALEDFLLTLAFGIEFTVSQFDINERACIKFAADPDVEAGTFEAVGRLAFFLFGVALCSDVLFSDPGLFFVVPDVDITEQVSVDYFVGSLPVARPEDLVQDSHIDARVLVKQKDGADAAGLCFADRLNSTVNVLLGNKGNLKLFH